jgi:hypothetical protein
MSNILIYDNLKNVDSSFTNSTKYNNLLKYNKKIYLLYDAKEINPPFFDTIILNHNSLNEEELKMVYNMTKVGGTIISKKKYNSFFKHFKINIFDDKDTTYYEFKKNTNIVLQTPYTRVVDFIIMGTQKGGTTSLAHNIGKHPDIYMDNREDPRISEVHFFDLNWKKGIDWYKRHFDYRKKMVGEKTPELMYLNYTFPLIQSVNPYLKIILILRNPVGRAYSAWKMIKSTKTFEEAVDIELDTKLKENKTFFTSQTHYLQRGLYYKQIKKLLKWFPKDNILILISEKFKNNMKEGCNEVYSFLNLKSFDTNYELKFMTDDKSAMDNDLYDTLIAFFKTDILKLEKLLKIKTGWLK